MLGAGRGGSRTLILCTFLSGAFGVSSSACGLILGLDSGDPLPSGPDAAAVDAFGAPDTFAAPPPGEGAEGSTGIDAPVSSENPPPVDLDSGVPPPPRSDARPPPPPPHGDACVSDRSWCDTHCGSGPDNCGITQDCPNDCAPNYVCGANQTCLCQREANWCAGRCGETTDNCGNSINCGTCDAGCQAESNIIACGRQQCGEAVNNCHQTVTCGLFGRCPLGVCLGDGGCCLPNNAAACGNQCGTTVTNNCGQTVACSANCGGGEVCYRNSCCTPDDVCQGACSVTKTNKCGQTVTCACSGSEECVHSTSTAGTCCTPTGCGGNCIDNCGVPSSACCPIADAGPDTGTNGDL